MPILCAPNHHTALPLCDDNKKIQSEINLKAKVRLSLGVCVEIKDYTFSPYYS